MSTWGWYDSWMARNEKKLAARKEQMEARKEAYANLQALGDDTHAVGYIKPSDQVIVRDYAKAFGGLSPSSRVFSLQNLPEVCFEWLSREKNFETLSKTVLAVSQKKVNRLKREVSQGGLRAYVDSLASYYAVIERKKAEKEAKSRKIADHNYKRQAALEHEG